MRKLTRLNSISLMVLICMLALIVLAQASAFAGKAVMEYDIMAHNGTAWERLDRGDLLSPTLQALYMTKVNAASGSANPFDYTGTLGIMNGSDDFTLFDINLTNANHTGVTNTVQIVDIANITGDADCTETAFRIGTGWDYAIDASSPVRITGVITNAFDAAAYWTATVADAGAVTFDDVSDGTAGFKFSDPVTFGSTVSVGILGGSGTSGSPTSLGAGAAGVKALSFYFNSTSITASHSLEGLYINTTYGVGATDPAPFGEAGRFRALLMGDAAGGTIAGSHSTVEWGQAGASNTGLTVGSRSNLVLPAATAGGGSMYGSMTELYTGGAGTDISGATAAIELLCISGTAPTSAAQMTIPVWDIVIPANLVADDVILDTAAAANAVGAKLRIRVNGIAYWIMLADASD